MESMQNECVNTANTGIWIVCASVGCQMPLKVQSNFQLCAGELWSDWKMLLSWFPPGFIFLGRKTLFLTETAEQLSATCIYITKHKQTNKTPLSDTKILPNVFSELVCQEWGVWLCTSDGHCHHLRNCKWIYKQESLTGKITPQICVVPQECAQECLDLLAQCKDLRYKKMENLIMFFESVVLQRSP